MKQIILLFLVGALAGCEDPSSIKVQNNLPNAIMRNVEWGGIPLSGQLLPGEESARVKIYEDGYYDIDLPEKHPLKFYIEVNGDKVYLQTRRIFELKKEEDIFIEISDTTQVINPLLEK